MESILTLAKIQEDFTDNHLHCTEDRRLSAALYSFDERPDRHVLI